MAIGAIALISGGLDSMLAARVALDCGVDLLAIHFQSPLTGLTPLAQQAADDLGLRLQIVEADESYLELVRRPRFGRCEAAAPCLDCREWLFRRIATEMDRHAAKFVITGEVLGQRRWGQRRRDLDAIAHRAGLIDLVVRPLSARLLSTTIPERNGWIDRGKLLDLQGKGRTRQLELAKRFNFGRIPAPLTHCCGLAQRTVGDRILATLQATESLSMLDCELAAVGRHASVGNRAAIVVSRNAAESERLVEIFDRYTNEQLTIVEPTNFRGPTALLKVANDNESVAIAQRMLVEKGKSKSNQPPTFRIRKSLD